MSSNLKIGTLGGNCPVQAEGTVDGHEFYFRARGSYWSMSIGGDDVVGKPAWYYEEPYGSGPYDAGHRHGMDSFLALILTGLSIR